MTTGGYPISSSTGGATSPTSAATGATSPTAVERKYNPASRRMTPELVAEACNERKMWGQAHLNTQLYLNYKGFASIEGLEDYVNVKALYLGSNNIQRIEGLGRMTELVSLYLEGNMIQSITGLEACSGLRLLNLEGNALKSVEGLKHLSKLENLNISKNAVEHLDDLKELHQLPALVHVDVSGNRIEDQEGVVEFWAELSKSLKLLRYHGNPGIRHVTNYRKRLINALPQLSYLDERPIFPIERRSCAAWEKGGVEAMQQAKQEYHKERTKENSIDPERGEWLTRQRKLAIARIEREEREKAEEAEAAAARGNFYKGAGQAKAPSDAVQEGDLEALAKYEKTWLNKVNEQGVDGVRESITNAQAVAAGGGGSQDDQQTAAAARKAALVAADAAASRERTSFKPPPRGPASAALTPATTAAATDNKSSTQSTPLWQNAADFREGGGRGAAAGLEESIEDRQFAVLGEDIYDGSSIGSTQKWNAALNSSTGACSRGKQGPFPARDTNVPQEVMPDIFARNLASNAEKEREALEMNMRAEEVKKDVPSTFAATGELASLD